MSINQCFRGLAMTAALAGAAAGAHANTFDINLAGWRAEGTLFDPGNSGVLVLLGEGAMVTNFSWSGLTFTATAASGSWRSEFVLTVQHDVPNWNLLSYLDCKPATQNSPGTVTNSSGTWSGCASSRKGGASFAVGESGVVQVLVWDTYNDPGTDEIVSAGTLTLTYTPGPVEVTPMIVATMPVPVPEPATYAFMVLGLGAIGGVLRRRRR